MKQQEVINFFVDDEPAFSATEQNRGAHTVVLENGIGWATIEEKETCLWDDIEVSFNESFDHSKINESEFLQAYETALHNLYEAHEKQDQEEEEEE
jgi:hypothetical protein